MNWEAVGAGAELLAAIGGLAAVIYLAVQIKLITFRMLRISKKSEGKKHGHEPIDESG